MSHYREQRAGNDISVRWEFVDCFYIGLNPGDGRAGG